MSQTRSLEITTVIGCRVACSFCPQSTLAKAYSAVQTVEPKARTLSLRDFERCLSSVPTDVRIDFSGMAEPWLNAECTEMVLHTHDRGHPIAIYTTGTGMTAEDVDRIAHIQFEVFMVHMPDREEHAKIPIDDTYREVIKAIDAKIEGTTFMTMGELNPEFESSHGSRLEPGSSVMNSRSGNIEDIEAYEAKGKVTCSVSSWLQHNVLVPSGDVVLCCNDYGLKHPLGNLLQQDYASLFYGGEYKRIISGLDEESDFPDLICRKCELAVTKRPVYDCFLFFEELDLLEIRLNELDSVVDQFVIAESATTFTGNPKPLVFAENRERFQAYAHKIRHVVIDDLPETGDAWQREHHSRDALVRGLTDCEDNALVLISDVDEIPKLETVVALTQRQDLDEAVFVLQQRFFYYAFNCESVRPLKAPLAVLWSRLRETTPQALRTNAVNPVEIDGFVTIPDGGWHFSNLGTAEQIRRKWQSFSHTEYDNESVIGLEQIQHKIDAGADLLDRDEWKFHYTEIDADFPALIRNNPERFAEFIRPLNETERSNARLIRQLADELHQLESNGAAVVAAASAPPADPGSEKIVELQTLRHTLAEAQQRLAESESALASSRADATAIRASKTWRLMQVVARVLRPGSRA